MPQPAPTPPSPQRLIRTMQRALCAIGLALGMAHAPAWALQPGDVPVLQGKTLAGAPFSLAALRGKVVLVLFWSTDCAVCRDKMPELRANAQGWRGKPFELVTISVDRRMQDAVAETQRPERRNRARVAPPQRADRRRKLVLRRPLHRGQPPRHPVQRTGKPQRAQGQHHDQGRQHHGAAHVTRTSSAKLAPTAG